MGLIVLAPLHEIQ